MKFLLYGLLVVAIITIGYQVYNLHTQRSMLKAQLLETDTRLQGLRTDQEKLNADLKYFADPQNLMKKLKEDSDYKLPGEKLLKIVPKNQPAAPPASVKP